MHKQIHGHIYMQKRICILTEWRHHFAIYPGHNTFFVGSIKTGDNIVDDQEKQTVSDENDLTAIRTMNQIIII